ALAAAESPAAKRCSAHGAPSKDPLTHVLPEDLHKFGLIPEFVGRLPVLTRVQPLGEDELSQILTQPHNAVIKQYQKLFRQDGAALRFTDDAIREIARQALAHGTGARSLRSVVERVLKPMMFDLPCEHPNTPMTVTAEMV